MVVVKNYEAGISPNEIFKIVLAKVLAEVVDPETPEDAALCALEETKEIISALGTSVSAKVLHMVPATGWQSVHTHEDGSTETVSLDDCMICSLDDGSIRILTLDNEGLWTEVRDDLSFSHYIGPKGAVK